MIREGRDIVIASRFEPGGHVVGLSRFREVLSLGASWMMRLLFGVRGCKDYTCGFRAYRAGVLREAQFVTAVTWCVSPASQVWPNCS